MTVLYSYLKHGGSIIACIPFRYNMDDVSVIDSREIILEVEPTTSYADVKQRLVTMLDKEKMENGKHSDEFTGDMSSVVTIE